MSKKALYWTLPSEKYLKLWENWKKDSNHKWCYNCKHFYYDKFCSYNCCMCRVHGSLDVDQKARHPDTTANTCPNYEEKR